MMIISSLPILQLRNGKPNPASTDPFAPRKCPDTHSICLPMMHYLLYTVLSRSTKPFKLKMPSTRTTESMCVCASVHPPVSETIEGFVE